MGAPVSNASNNSGLMTIVFQEKVTSSLHRLALKVSPSPVGRVKSKTSGGEWKVIVEAAYAVEMQPVNRFIEQIFTVYLQSASTAAGAVEDEEMPEKLPSTLSSHSTRKELRFLPSANSMLHYW